MQCCPRRDEGCEGRRDQDAAPERVHLLTLLASLASLSSSRRRGMKSGSPQTPSPPLGGEGWGEEACAPAYDFGLSFGSMRSAKFFSRLTRSLAASPKAQSLPRALISATSFSTSSALLSFASGALVSAVLAAAAGGGSAPAGS